MTEQVTKTITMLDRSTQTLVKTGQTLSKTMAELLSLIESSETVASDIQFQSSELAAIDSLIADGRRTAEAQMKIEILEDEDKVLSKLMHKNELATITHDALQTLMTEKTDAVDSKEDAVEKSVATALNALNTKHKYGMEALEAAHKTDTAELNADVKAKDNEIHFLKVALQNSQNTLEAERKARVDIAASAAGAQGVIVNTSGK